jgi:hypothetical protein
LTSRLSSAEAEIWGRIHEVASPSSASGKRSQIMDLRNNLVGRAIGRKLPHGIRAPYDLREAERRCMDALNDGRLWIIRGTAVVRSGG